MPRAAFGYALEFSVGQADRSTLLNARAGIGSGWCRHRFVGGTAERVRGERESRRPCADAKLVHRPIDRRSVQGLQHPLAAGWAMQCAFIVSTTALAIAFEPVEFS